MTYPTQREDLIQYLLRLGDTALVQGQRLCEWCGGAPAIEEELALMNVGLDLVGQSRNWLEYAAELLDDGRDADHLAFRRDERAYRNLLLVEQPNGDYAVTMTKQFLYDAWHLPVLQGLSQSRDERIAGIAAKAVKEVTYHLRRSGEWIERLGDGTEESHARMLKAVTQLWRFTVEFTSADDVELRLFQAGIAPDPQYVASAWQSRVGEQFARATLPLPDAASHFYLSGRQGLHTEHLGLLLAEMQFLQRAYPDATW
ncbi:1,2-phenylacetyl-CoA epoxidase subunit PaaC [uncultured Pseudomonas sp.]|uniref:1,2-phenylacetyl-CoA epoxidase subunit PaaC n=1 Tax=uncultured Pseudomonas sp. TaxID=114707 RepID=UPI0025EF7D64|nr:1,2-phenylacetyl-CoA epoxidase subunit PaaC [uncultured Pseudomonas sp.]